MIDSSELENLDVSYIYVSGSISCIQNQESNKKINFNFHNYQPNGSPQAFFALDKTGSITIKGKEKDSYQELGKSIKINDTQLVLQSSPKNWQKGDQLLITGRNKKSNRKLNTSTSDELIQLKSSNPDNSYQFINISKKERLNYFRKRHKNPKRSKFKIPVLNLSRSINFNSINSGNSSNAIFSAFGGSLNLEHITFHNWGSKNFAAINLLNKNGELEYSSIKSCVINNSLSKGIVNNSYNINFSNNIINSVNNTGYEDFSELNHSQINNNIVINSKQDGYKFHSPQAFQNFRNNYALNIAGSGLNIDIEENSNLVSFEKSNLAFQDEILSLQNSKLQSSNFRIAKLPVSPIHNFNVFNANKGISIRSLIKDNNGFDQGLSAHNLESKFNKINLVNIFDTAIDVQESSRLDFENLEIIGSAKRKSNIAFKQDQNARFISIRNSKIQGFKTAVILGQTASSKLDDEVDFGGTDIDNLELAFNSKNFEAVTGSDLDNLSLLSFSQRSSLKAPLSPYNKIKKVKNRKSNKRKNNTRVDFEASPIGGLSYLFNAENSVDKSYQINWKNLRNSIFSSGNNSIASYAWDTDDDGVDDSWGRYINKHFEEEGIHRIRLTVTDSGGKEKSLSKEINIKFNEYNNVIKDSTFNELNLTSKEFIDWSDYQFNWILLGNGLSSVSENNNFNFAGKGKSTLAQVIYDKSRTEGIQNLNFNYSAKEDIDFKLKVYGINGKFRYYQNSENLIQMNISEDFRYDILYESENILDELGTDIEKNIEIDFQGGYDNILLIIDLEDISSENESLSTQLLSKSLNLNQNFLVNFDNFNLSSSRTISSNDYLIREEASTEAKTDILEIITNTNPNRGNSSEESEGNTADGELKANQDLYYLTRNSFKIFNPLLNDIYSNDDDNISIIFTETDKGIVIQNGQNKNIFKFTPSQNFTGTIEVPYIINNGFSSSESKIIFIVQNPAPPPVFNPAPPPSPPSGVSEVDLVLSGLFKDPGFQNELGNDFNFSNTEVFDSTTQFNQSWQVPSASSNWQKDEVNEYAFANNTGETSLIQAVLDNNTHTGSLDLSFDVRNQGLDNVLRVQVYGINGHFKLSHTLVNQDPLAADVSNPITFNKLIDTGNVIDSDFDWTHFTFKDISLATGYQFLVIRIITDHVDIGAGDFLNIDTVFLRSAHSVSSSYPERLFRRPSLGNDSIAVIENGSITFNVFDNDSDPDGDTMTIAANTIPSNGVLIPRGSGEFEYLPNANYTGADSFTYTVNDGIFINSATVNINVTNDPNQVPPAPPPPPPVNIVIDPEFSAAFSAQFNINSGETVSNNADTGWWRPGGNEWNKDSVNEIAWVNAPNNEALTQIVDDNFTTAGMQDFAVDVRANGTTHFSIEVWGMTGNNFILHNNLMHVIPYDPNGDPATVKLLAKSSDLTSDGIMPWTRFEFKNIDFGTGYKFIGIRLVTEYVDYGSGEYLEIDNVFLGSNPPNSALPLIREISPNAVDDLVDVTKNSLRTFSVLTNDTDPENDALSVESITNPSHGSIINNGNGIYDYVPDTDYIGSDSMTYVVTDGILVNEATVTFNIIDGPSGDNGSSFPINLIQNSDFINAPSANGPIHNSTNSSIDTWLRPNSSTFNHDAVNNWLYLDNIGAGKLTYQINDNNVSKNTVTFSYDYKVTNNGHLAFKVIGSDLDFQQVRWFTYDEPLNAPGTATPVAHTEVLNTGNIITGTVGWTHGEHSIDLGASGYKYIYIYLYGSANNGRGEEVLIDNVELIR